jgi:hypothetical protein
MPFVPFGKELPLKHLSVLGTSHDRASAMMIGSASEPGRTGNAGVSKIAVSLMVKSVIG